MSGKRKYYYIKTYGCQANIADSIKMGDMLENTGFEFYFPKNTTTETEELKEVLENVDILIINTCSVRQKSEDKAYGLGKVILETKRKNDVKGNKDAKARVPFIIMSGCVVGSATGDRKLSDIYLLSKKTPWVDLYISPSEIPMLLSKITETNQKLLTESDLPKVSSLKSFNRIDYGYVNISTGCDNFCSYCVVPYSRGKEISRTKDEILSDVTRLVKQGYKNIMLLGQNVNSWGLSPSEKLDVRIGKDIPTPFADLLTKVHEVPELERLSFMSSNPFDFTKALIDVLSLPKLDRYLHIAVQSGNNEILKKMNRRHTVEEFISLVNTIKKKVPEMSFGTDIIVGFPGETKEQFMDTVELFRKIRFDVAYISKYSPRKGTTAQKLFIDDVSPSEKSRRHVYLTKVWKQSSH